MFKLKTKKAILLSKLFFSLGVFILGNLISIGSVSAYNMPIGIPDPGFGLDAVKPDRPANWTTEIAGYYYIEDTAGCDDSQTYGYPGHPKCYIPNPIPAGSRVEVHGTYSHTVGGLIKVEGEGTVSDPIWLVGESEDKPLFTDQVMIIGRYIYIDGVKSYVTGTNDTCFKFGTGTHPGYQVDHCMIRNSEMSSNSDKKSSGVSVGGYHDDNDPNNNEPSSYIIIAHNHMHGFGILYPQPRRDVDAHVVTVNKKSDHVWVLDNTIHDAGGAGIIVGQEGPSWGQDDNSWIFFGRNNVYNTLQANLSVKGVTHVVFSENNAHDPVVRWLKGVVGDYVASPSKCFGWKGEPQDYWIINNTCQNASYGVHGGATVDNKQFFIYILNNTFRHIYTSHPESYDGRNTQGESAISLVRGGYDYVIGNSIYDAVAGIVASGPGGTAKDNYHYYIENNIISNIGLSHMVLGSKDNPAQTYVRNNIIYQPDESSELIRWGGHDYTGDLSGWKTDSGTGQNTVITDPKYYSPNNNSFYLRDGSPAIDTGLADSDLSSNVYNTFQSTFGFDIRKDINLDTRPQGAGWDIGADEKTNLLGPKISNGSPNGDLSSDTTSITLQVSTDVASTCKYNTNSKIGIPYSNMDNIFTTTDGLTHTASITGLHPRDHEYYAVRCSDGTNTNTVDYIVPVHVKELSIPHQHVRYASSVEAGEVETQYGNCANGDFSCKNEGFHMHEAMLFFKTTGNHKSILKQHTPFYLNDEVESSGSVAFLLRSDNVNREDIFKITSDAGDELNLAWIKDHNGVQNHLWLVVTNQDGTYSYTDIVNEGSVLTGKYQHGFIDYKVTMSGGKANVWIDTKTTDETIISDISLSGRGTDGTYKFIAGVTSSVVNSNDDVLIEYSNLSLIKNINEPICDSSHPNLCTDQSTCEGATGHWCSGVCQASECNTTIRADVDQQNGITSTDAMLTLRNSLGLDMAQTNWQVSTTTGDVNCDGNSNSTDAMLILRKSLGLDMTGAGWCGE